MNFINFLKKAVFWIRIYSKSYTFKILFGKNVTSSPIFIVSCGHSGSSLLLNILGSHSNIYAIPGESNFLEKKNIKSILKRFDLLTIYYKKNRWLEKTPKHVRSIATIKNFFPTAKFIYLLRDGRDVSISIKKRTGDIIAAAKRWRDDNLMAEAFLEDENLIRIKYEELVSTPEETLKEIFAFLSEDYEDGCLNYHSAPKFYYSSKIFKPQNAKEVNHKQYRNWQINQPLFDGRGKWINMSDEDKINVKKIINEKLKEYGYIDSCDW